MFSVYPFKGVIHRSITSHRPSYYIYEVKSHLIHLSGLVCSVGISSILDKKILPHEEIFPKKEAALLNFFKEQKIQNNPILLITDECTLQDKILELSQNAENIGEPVFHKAAEHRLSQITSNSQPFTLADSICVADGHHRLSALLRYHKHVKSKTIMAAIFSTHMVQTRSKGVIVQKQITDSSHFWNNVNYYFDVEVLAHPKEPLNPTEFVMVKSRKWYQLNLKRQFSRQAPYDWLALDFFKKYILNEIFFLSDYTTIPSVKVFFDVCNISSLKIHSDNENHIGFVLSADHCSRVLAAARTGRLLEPNSTYFEPKFLDGVISHHLDET